MGPFELGDQAGLDIAAGMFDTIAAAGAAAASSRWSGSCATRSASASRAAPASTTTRTARRRASGRASPRWCPTAAPASPPADEIVERCARALYDKARELCDRKIVASEEECDLAFVFGIGFAMYLGGPIFYGKQRGW